MFRWPGLFLILVTTAVAACDREPAEPVSVQPSPTLPAAEPEPAAPEDEPAEQGAAHPTPDEALGQEATEPDDTAESPKGPVEFKELVAGADRVELSKTQPFMIVGEDPRGPVRATVTDPDAIQAFVFAVGPRQVGERLPRMKCMPDHGIEFYRAEERLARFQFLCGSGGSVGRLYGSGLGFGGFDYRVQHPRRMGRLVRHHLGSSD